MALAFKRVHTLPSHMLNFIATDLQLYNIFKIMRLSFLGTQYVYLWTVVVTFLFKPILAI